MPTPEVTLRTVFTRLLHAALLLAVLPQAAGHRVLQRLFARAAGGKRAP